MTELVKVKFPRAKKGWALLAPSDLSKPKPDGSLWELYVEEAESKPSSSQSAEIEMPFAKEERSYMASSIDADRASPDTTKERARRRSKKGA